MGIETASRKYTDNLRKFRRTLQGRGVNLRQTVVVADVYAENRVAVPGLHDDDVVFGLVNLTDGVDISGYLDDDPGDKASLDVFSGNKGVTFTARRGGSAGNKLYVKAAADPGAAAPLSVTVGPYDAVLGTTGNPGKTAVLVNLATDSGGVALTGSDNSAANVRAAVLQSQAAAKLVDAALDGDGSTAWTATGPTALAGGDDFRQGPSTASLEKIGPYDDDNVRYVARKAGANGNAITVAHEAGGSLAVGVSGTAITVTYVVGTTTAKQAVAAVNASAAAAALVIASPGPDDVDGSGLLGAMVATNLTGGQDPGLQLTVDAAGTMILVSWVTRNERDEN